VMPGLHDKNYREHGKDRDFEEAQQHGSLGAGAGLELHQITDQ
jgi:hypothetical protein